MIRAARDADNAQIAAIWNLEAVNTTATTETGPRSPEAQRAWLTAHNAAYPALVATVGDEVVAFVASRPTVRSRRMRAPWRTPCT